MARSASPAAHSPQRARSASQAALSHQHARSASPAPVSPQRVRSASLITSSSIMQDIGMKQNINLWLLLVHLSTPRYATDSLLLRHSQETKP